MVPLSGSASSSQHAISTIFDLGMHNGDEALIWFRQGFRVVSIEANPAMVAAVVGPNHMPNSKHVGAGCRRDASREDANLIVLNRAISNVSNATIPFCVNRNSVASSVLNVEGGECGGKRVHVKTVTCADLFWKYGRPWSVKIDIEGKEADCIDSILALPEHMLPDLIRFESPLRWPMQFLRCDAACVDTFLRTVRAMASRGYVDWKRQWWRAQSKAGILAAEVKDRGKANKSVWVNTSEVERMGCGFFPVANALELKTKVVRSLSQSTGCDLFARRTPGADGVARELTAARQPPNPAYLNGSGSPWREICRAGLMQVEDP